MSEPGRPNRRFSTALKKTADPYLGPDEWVENAAVHEGSWWTSWVEWLGTHSTQERIAPPSMGNAEKGLAPLDDAPGTYVLQR